MNIWLFRRLMEAAQEGGAAEGNGSGTADTAARAETERRAQQMGWAPKDQWRGDPKHWIDADAFVRRGEEVMPLLQANNRKLEVQVQGLQTQLQQAVQQLTAAHESIEVLKSVSTKQVISDSKQKRKDLLRQQAEARRENNTELEVQLGEEIEDVTAELRSAEAEAAEAPTAAASAGKKGAKGGAASAGSDPAQDPAFLAWKAENPWFGVDEYKSAIATAAGMKLRKDPVTTGLVGKAFFDKVSEEVNAFFKVHQQAAAGGGRGGSKVEGGGGGGAGNGGGGGGPEPGRSYNDLPADAKAACERSAARVVGEGRAFKTLAEWRAHYVKVYEW